MPIQTDAQIIDGIVKSEGSTYTNNPADKGGPTKYGITLATLARFRKKPCTAKDVENLTEAEAENIYMDMYVNIPNFYKIVDPALRYLVIDSGVLHGQGTAAEWLQSALGVTADGDFGPKSQAALLAFPNPRKLFVKVLASRIRFDAKLVTSDYYKAKVKYSLPPLQAEFSQGWADRSCRFLDMLAEV